MEGFWYSVKGKGGLIRAIKVPVHLSNQLETMRLATPKIVHDRQVVYLSHYDVTGGQAWSQNFSRTSDCLFNWSNGGHGIRHDFAQRKMDYHQSLRLSKMALTARDGGNA